MASPLSRAHIEAERRLRTMIARAAGGAWRRLPAYDERNVDEWLARVVPLVIAGQRTSIALTEAYIARARERQPLGLNADEVIGRVRGETTPEEVYRRPFVTTWSALGAGAPWEDAVASGLAQATSSAATDMQLAMTHTASAVGEADPGIYGFEREPDGDACELCLIASTQRYHVEDLMPIHNNCGCTTTPITEPADQVINRDLYEELKADGAMQRITDQRQRARIRDSGLDAVEVRPHGELGPVLTNPAHDFTTLDI